MLKSQKGNSKLKGLNPAVTSVKQGCKANGMKANSRTLSGTSTYQSKKNSSFPLNWLDSTPQKPISQRGPGNIPSKNSMNSFFRPRSSIGIPDFFSNLNKNAEIKAKANRVNISPRIRWSKSLDFMSDEFLNGKKHETRKKNVTSLSNSLLSHTTENASTSIETIIVQDESFEQRSFKLEINPDGSKYIEESDIDFTFRHESPNMQGYYAKKRADETGADSFLAEEEIITGKRLLCKFLIENINKSRRQITSLENILTSSKEKFRFLKQDISNIKSKLEFMYN